MNIVTTTCIRCHVTPVTIPDTAMEIGGICDDCIAAEQRETALQEAAKLIQRKWESICPVLYQDTMIDKLPHLGTSKKALKWPFMLEAFPDTECSWMGLNLWGFPRTGKTRTLFLVLKRAHWLGRTIKFFGPSQFAQECEMRDFKTASWLRGIVNFDIVAFDDIDKCKLTRQQEEKFFALLDARISRRVPTFFTGNTRGDDLKLQFRNGEAIVARMREHSVSIHFPQQQQLL